MDNLELTGTRPPSVASNRPVSRNASRPRSGYHKLADTSNVDELLFTSNHVNHNDEINCQSPWSNTPRNKHEKDRKKQPKIKPLLWAPEGRTKSSPSIRNVLRSSNKNHNVHSSIDSEKLNKYRPLKYKASFVDESLFGPRLEEPSFAAPWAEKVKRPKPFIFSPVDYTQLTRENTQGSLRYSSAGTLDGRPPSRQGRRPATASTRPVTVEGTGVSQKPLWKP